MYNTDITTKGNKTCLASISSPTSTSITKFLALIVVATATTLIQTMDLRWSAALAMDGWTSWIVMTTIHQLTTDTSLKEKQ